jgi:hypothetical protein
LALGVCLWLFLRHTQGAVEALEGQGVSLPPRVSRALDPLDAVEPATSRVGLPLSAPRASPSAGELSTAAPCTVHLFGSFLDSNGALIRKTWWANVRLVDERDTPVHRKTEETGTFDFGELPCGRYWAAARADGYATIEEIIELRPGSGELRHDFVFRKATELEVRVKTPDGRNLFDVLSQTVPRPNIRTLVPVATRDAPGKRFEGVVGSMNNKFGVGMLWNYGPRVKALGPGVMGILVLDIEPPLYVSLVHYQSVLRTERIEAGQREITFVITPQELLDDLANIRQQSPLIVP